MDTQGREQLFLKIMVFFAVVTAFTAIINLASSGAVTLGDMGSGNYMQTLPGQVSPNINPGESGNSIQGTIQDYTTSTGYNQNFTKISTEFIAGDTFIRYDGVGYLSVYTPISDPKLAYLDLIGVTPVNNVYDVTYHVYDQFSDAPFYVLYSGAETGSGFVVGSFVKFDTSGISLVDNRAIGTILQSIPYPYANSGQTIETKFNPVDHTLEVSIDGNDAGTFTSVIGTGSVGLYNGGIAASKSGLQVHEIDSNFVIILSQQSVDTNILSSIAGFFSMVGSMLGLTSNPLIPFWLWACMGIPCLSALVLIGIEVVRGD
jgi:hypothetical protein